MNVDTQFPQVPLATLPSRAPHTRPDQASARPVDRPHHDEPANNRSKQGADQAGARQELAAEERHGEETEASRSTTPSTDTRFSRTSEPAQVGELIDVLV